MNTIHIMKKSLYNHLSFIDESWVLYNAFTDEVSVLAPEVKDLSVFKLTRLVLSNNEGTSPFCMIKYKQIPYICEIFYPF